jgi:hypothetical protein
MKDCQQTKGQSTLEHGFSVKNYLFDLVSHLRKGSPLKYNWNIPNWVYDSKDLILNNLPDEKTLKLYTIFHDIGKWKCLTIDDDGKRHFPNHSQVSYQYFTQVFNNPAAADLILHDMDIHLLKSDGVEEFSKNPYALTLLLTGLAEIHSNSTMFGGIDSVSFKIKHKCISKRGTQIINLIKNKK